MRPIPAEEFSNLVSSIYECALDPAGWTAVLEELAERMDFRMSSLILATTPIRGALPLIDISTGITPEARASMLSHGQAAIDAWGPPGTFAALPLETPMIRSTVNPEAARTPYVQEQCLPLGFFDNMSIMFSRERESFCVVSFNRHLDEGAIGGEEVDLARLFVPHLKRALVISRLLEARTVERATFAAVLDGLAVAVLLVGPELRLLHANRAGEAMLRAGDPLGQRHGRLTAPNGLAAALRVALDAQPDGIGRRGLGIPARRADGEELVLHLLPLAETGTLPGARAAIFVAPAVAPRPAPLAAIAALFDLTPTEARVLELLGAGRTNAEVAVALGIAVSTVRTHLLRLFEKTGTHRQAELVALVNSFSLPLG